MRLAASEQEYHWLLASLDLEWHVLLRRVAFQRSLRDVRHAPGEGVRNVIYHVAIYAGRTDLPPARFRPQPSEIQELRYFDAGTIDRMLLAGALAPNMAFLWLTQAHALLEGVARGR